MRMLSIFLLALLTTVCQAGPVLGRLSVLPLTDPIATQATGAAGIANYIAQGWDAEFYFENSSSTLFTNNHIRIVFADDTVFEGLLGNIAPGQVLPGFSYPIATFWLFAWDEVAEGVRGGTYFPRPSEITFTSDQSVPVTLRVGQNYDSGDILGIPEPQTLVLTLTAIGLLAMRKRLSTL